MPIYQTATFVQPSATLFGPYDYTRSGNPTRTALEQIVAKLESAYAAFAFTSGMAALSALTRLLQAGDEMLLGDDIYGGMYRLVHKVATRHGITIRDVDVTDLSKVEAAITPRTKILHMETPSNPMMRITDIRRLAAFLKSRGVLLSIDSTMMTPYLQKPLQLGADIVVHSATKFLGGHSDLTAGVICVRNDQLAKQLAFFQNAEGTALAPFECWLMLRGIKTLAVRVDRAQANAMRLARALYAHPLVTCVRYAGLDASASGWERVGPGGEAARKDFLTHTAQAKGGGSVISFETGSVQLSRRFVDAVRLFKITVSFGSVNSLVELPCLLSHASIPADKRTIPEDLVRISVGIEDIDDLVADLDRALHVAASSARNVRKATARL